MGRAHESGCICCLHMDVSPSDVHFFVDLSDQASRARQLGATVYCVGVKDFNETQVNPSNDGAAGGGRTPTNDTLTLTCPDSCRP